MIIKLGSRVKEKLTGLVGIAYSRVEYLNGCLHYGVQPPIDKDGKVPQTEFFDVSQLTVLDEENVPKRFQEGIEDKPAKAKVPGGPAGRGTPSR